MKNLDVLFDIQESFIRFVRGSFEYTEKVTRDDNGKERALLELSVGFFVELTNQQDVENSASLRCWWYSEENAVEISTEEELFNEFMNRR